MGSNWIAIITMLTSFLGTLAGSGPWGIGAMALGALGVVGSVGYMISRWNSSTDAGDLERAGADAGQTAVDLKNQADANREFENRTRDEILKAGPPKP